MALQRIRFDVAGDVQYSRAFEAAAHEAEDLSDPLEKIGQSLLRSIGEQFRSEGAFGLGSKWKPLNKDYARWKEDQVGDQPILVFHGTMRAAMTDRLSIHVSPRRMVYEPKAPDYAIYHQEGDEEHHLPKRKMVELPESERRLWDRFFADWLTSLRREKLAGL